MANYDIIGNIVVVKFKRSDSKYKKNKWARDFLREHKNVTSVLEKTERFKGRLRVQKTRFLAGANTKESLYRENGCYFRFNVDTCYFSPRLASERQDIAKKVKKGEDVLVLFGGVAPFAIVIAKNSKAAMVTSIELSKACSRYAVENVKRNKLDGKVEIVQGDVRRKLPPMKKKFDRIIMARPNLKDSFLDVTFSRIKNKGIIHYYGFCYESELENMKSMIITEAKEVKRKVKLINVKKAGDIGTRRYRYRIDILILR